MSENLRPCCDQEGCTVHNDGKCLEGFEDLNQCPHCQFVEVEDEVSVEEEINIANSEEELEFNLPDGLALNAASARSITRDKPTHLILIAGDEESGKTTLLASLYECFLVGPFGQYSFAGSQSLVGFEARCYLSRIHSGRSFPETERTKPGASDTLLHLRVFDKSKNKQTDLLFSDLPGEIFRLAKDSTEECKKLKILHRCDRFVLLLDCERLIDFENRHETFANGVGIIRSCLDSEMLRGDVIIDVLFTKWDSVELQTDNKDEFLAYFGHIRENMEQKFGLRVGALRFFNVAARPKTSALNFAYGIKDFFSLWVEEKSIQKPIAHKFKFEDINALNLRHFDRFIFSRNL